MKRVSRVKSGEKSIRVQGNHRWWPLHPQVKDVVSSRQDGAGAREQLKEGETRDGDAGRALGAERL